MRSNCFILTETKLFHFHRIYKNGGGGSSEKVRYVNLTPFLTHIRHFFQGVGINNDSII